MISQFSAVISRTNRIFNNEVFENTGNSYPSLRRGGVWEQLKNREEMASPAYRN